MRASFLLSVLVATTALAAGGPRVAPEQVARHRAELVTLLGPVTEVRSGADGLVLVIGTEPGVPVLVPARARERFHRDLTALHRRRVQVTGFVTPSAQPLALVLEYPEHLVVEPPPTPDGVRALGARVGSLEDELARLAARTPFDGETGVVYGPVSPPLRPLPRYATQATVLAERGLPTRIEWGPRRRVLYYGRERWTFDADGQLATVRGD